MPIIDQTITDRYALYNGDCLEVMAEMPDASIDLSIYSPPFAGLYVYSSSDRDLSNCRTYEEFLAHYEFVIKEISRLTKPGRISAVHCMDVPKFGANICGYIDFPGDIIRIHEKHGFEYLPRICIWKEPLSVRNRTMAKALAHCQIVEDSTKTNVAGADYLIPFRKKGENKVPVTHEHGFQEYFGERQMPGDVAALKGFTGNQIKNRYSHWIWRQYASCFWDDIRGNLGENKHDGVLPYKESKDPQDERHVHPLQLDVIERAVVMWSNLEEVVWTPFLGVGSEVFGAVRNGRKGIGAELKPTYYRQACENLKSAHVKPVEQPSLF